MLKALVIIWGMTLFLGPALASSCKFDGENVSLATQSTSGQSLEMNFPGGAIRKHVTQVLVGSDQALDIASAKLWMPSMEHGSAPTRLVRVSDSCIKIENVKFLMVGDWEIQLKLVGDQSAVFSFDVE